MSIDFDNLYPVFPRIAAVWPETSALIIQCGKKKGKISSSAEKLLDQGIYYIIMIYLFIITYTHKNNLHNIFFFAADAKRQFCVRSAKLNSRFCAQERRKIAYTTRQ